MLIVGIDFGTTTSAIGYIKGGSPVLLKMDGGKNMMPSIVAFNKMGDTIVGQKAKKQAILNPEKTFRSIKRMLGENKTVQVDKKEWRMEELGAIILEHLKMEAEKDIGQAVTHAVITVPAYFNQIQRESVQEIGKLAGMEVVRIINEPTAAAMAYSVDTDEEKNLLVFDFGGGTFDVSIMTIADGVFEVKATGGDSKLGGDDIDRLIIDKVIEDFKNRHGIDLSQDKMAKQKLLEEAEKLKITLSDSDSARFNIPFIAADQHGPIHLDFTFTSEILELMVKNIVARLMTLVRQTIRASGLSKKDIDHILLAGGSTRIPAVRNAVVDYFGEKLVGGVNPMECVALGASVQAGILSGKMEQRVLLDVTPLTLGLEIDGGDTEPVIQKNTTIPVSHKKTFTTVADDQTEVEIKVVQGNSNRADENIALGKFILGGIHKAKKGEAKVEVEFDIDVNGIMSVSAVDKLTGIEKSIKLERSIVKQKADEN